MSVLDLAGPNACSANTQRIIDACERHWEAHKANCSGFVRAVAGELGVPLFGLANEIVDYIDKAWLTVEGGNQGRLFAEAGYLVVAGLKAKGHGHVVVVVPGSLAHGKYPTAYWGRIASVGKKNTTLNWSWNKHDRDKVIYRATRIAS